MYTLRPYQQEAVDLTLKHFRKTRDPALIVLPTGAGKSLVIAELARIARGRVLVLAHVKELVEQNYAKFLHYKLSAGIYSAGLQRKDTDQKVIFGSIQSVARAESDFFKDFSLLIIDECHRVSGEAGTQYTEVINRIRNGNPDICVLGLTATPYRLDTGWIYEYHYSGELRSTTVQYFKRCLFELSLRTLIDGGYLVPPVQIDAPVAHYDFSSLKLESGREDFNIAEIDKLLQEQNRITPVIIKNIVELAAERKGVIIFTSSVRHAKEILTYLPQDTSAVVTGETDGDSREAIINNFKSKKIKFLVNVSVLTTGFDAPHVDVVAILRPTESVALYQQIVGRGLRLSEGKVDCLVLDYTGVPHDIFIPRIYDRKPFPDAEAVEVECPQCEHVNGFWGVIDAEGAVLEHFGQKCKGATVDPRTGEIVPCGFRYRFKNCDRCAAENDLNATACATCGHSFPDDESILKDAISARDSHVMRPDSMTFEKKVDARGLERLEIRYYDNDGKYLSEVFFFSSPSDAKVFYYNFVRMHRRVPDRTLLHSIETAIASQPEFRIPLYVIARKQERFWKIREKIFL